MEHSVKKNPVSFPSIDNLKKLNEKHKVGCNEDELEEYQSIMKNTVAAYNFIDDQEVPSYVSKYGGNREYVRPEGDENKYNAWYVKCNIEGASSGKLAGKRIAIKDNIAVANIPMMNGSKVVEGYIPEYDATIVQRILEAGGTICGKTTCEDLCASGGSIFTAYGPVRNPHNTKCSSGGSSSGSAVVVAVGECDMAIGGDQGGSIRIPSSNCGIVGMKPTHGLVPYTGAVPVIPCVDHLGPMAKNVADCALLLEVIAGYDNGFDYRQRPFQVPEYSKLIFPHVKPSRKLNIGVLQEGIDLCAENVKDVFNASLKHLKDSEHLCLKNTSLPKHAENDNITSVIFGSGTFESMINGCGFGVSGMQSHTLAKKMFDGYRQHFKDTAETVKLQALMSYYIHENYGSYHYAKASTLAQYLKFEYDKLLNQYDVIIMPTLKETASEIPPQHASVTEKITSVFYVNKNTAIFNITGHPALSLNCGFDKDLPVGLMIVGKHYDELGVLNAASIFEDVFAKWLDKKNVCT
ncbi:amidase-like [Hydractinia symbiolongicarpus]|uniref:amidase-like n=1 Tax=Hydractinia symbiolongicarpus TaxID=13093 RepID=UPI00255021AD|nr:amidase-like [Hydractinia symbiolongicarpus]XP_057297736.1 amidase-like [Hydractinia symbiolongicarpus]